MFEDYLVCLGISFLILHEMDAVKNQEWKMFFVLSKLNETSAYVIFSLLHIPLFGSILLLLLSANMEEKIIVTSLLDGFYCIHFLLHVVFYYKANNQFKTGYSWVIITLLMLLGLTHFIVIMN